MPHIYLTFQIDNMYVWTNAATKGNDRNIMFSSHRNQIVARELLVHQYLWHDVFLNNFSCLYVSFVWTLTTYFKDTGFFGRHLRSRHTAPSPNSKSKVFTFSSLSRAYFQNYTQKHLWGKQGRFGLRMDWQYHQRGNVMWRKSSNGVLPG